LAKYNDKRAKPNLTKLLNDRYPGIREKAEELLNIVDQNLTSP